MSLRILFILLAFFTAANLVISLVSIIFGVNLYKTHGKLMLKALGVFILFIAAVFIVFSIMGLI